MKTRELLKSEAEWAAIAIARGRPEDLQTVSGRVSAILTAIGQAGGHDKHARNVYEHFKHRKLAEMRAAALKLGE